MRFYAILFCLISTVFQVQAQVKAPNLLCISADSLIFSPPTNTCGDFINYEVYASQSRVGIYELIGTIDQKISSSFVHQSITPGVWYYYMQSNFACSGEAVLSSDTLDNITPDVAYMKNVTIENDLAILNWYPSLSPQTVAYVVHKLTDQGMLPYDTVFFNTSYIDVFALPNEKSAIYTVVAMDACGNFSEFVESQRSIFLEISSSPCDQNITLHWNLYENWDGGVEAHEIWASKDGATAERLAVIQGSETTYVIENIEQGIDYSFFVNALEGGTGVSAKSNKVGNTGNIVQAVGDLLLKNVSFTDANEVELTWEWNEEAALKKVELFSSSDNLSFESIGTPNATAPLANPATFQVAPSHANEMKTFYRLTTVDNCDTSTISNYISTIFLSSSSQPNRENLLTWTPYDSKIGNVVAYSIYKIVDNTPLFVAKVNGMINTFSDPITTVEDATACYYIEAEISVLFAQSGIETVISRSNTTCLAPKTDIVIPNAFAPNGYNQIFKPTVLFADGVQQYRMTIYDRYGGKIFESQDINIGWNGLNRGKQAPQGTYSYHIQMTQSNGEQMEKAGILMLIR